MTDRVRPRLRDLTSADVSRILEITRATGVFRDEELIIAEEVVRDCVNHPGPTGGDVGAELSSAHKSPKLRPYKLRPCKPRPCKPRPSES